MLGLDGRFVLRHLFARRRSTTNSLLLDTVTTLIPVQTSETIQPSESHHSNLQLVFCIMPHSEEKIRIAIAGGGIGGLCLAVGLMDKPNLDVHIYEGVPKYTDIGAGLALHKNAITAMDLIHPAIKKTYFAKALTMAGEEDEEMVTQVILVSGPNTGEVVAELGKAKGRRTVARSDLLDGLLALLPKDRVTFGKKLDSIKEDDASGKVTLTFKDGTTAEADGLLGADGVHSGTRKHILGPDHPAVPPMNPDGWRVHSRQVPMEIAMKTIDPKWSRTVPILCGKEGHVNMMPLHRGKVLSIICVTRTGIASDGSIAPFEKERFEDYREDAKAAVEVSQNHSFTTDKFRTDWNCNSWSPKTLL
jgi:salicylate hydroxylase